VSKEERDERDELEQDLKEDLELDEESADNVRGGRAKTAEKMQEAMDKYLRG
jgi:hypothetical protein